MGNGNCCTKAFPLGGRWYKDRFFRTDFCDGWGGKSSTFSLKYREKRNIVLQPLIISAPRAALRAVAFRNAPAGAPPPQGEALGAAAPVQLPVFRQSQAGVCPRPAMLWPEFSVKFLPVIEGVQHQKIHRGGHEHQGQHHKLRLERAGPELKDRPQEPKDRQKSQ